MVSIGSMVMKAPCCWVGRRVLAFYSGFSDVTWGQSPGKTGGWEQLSFFFFFNFILFLNFTILYWFCQISKWICHRYTCVPHPEPSSLLPPHTIPLGRPSAPAPSIQYHASNLDWRLVPYMILYVFQCHSPKSSHPFPLREQLSINTSGMMCMITVFIMVMVHKCIQMSIAL